MTSRESLIRSLDSYKTSFPEESIFIPRFRELLTQSGCFKREFLPGHITGSAWIINEAGTRVVMVKHGSLHRWLQPGGHADGDENTLATAIREAREETGVSDLRLIGDSWFDLDIHTIPEKKNFPQHEHYDIRFMFVASDDCPLVISDESTDLRWIDLDILERYNSERAILRLREKTISNLRAAGQTRR